MEKADLVCNTDFGGESVAGTIWYGGFDDRWKICKCIGGIGSIHGKYDRADLDWNCDWAYDGMYGIAWKQYWKKGS